MGRLTTFLVHTLALARSSPADVARVSVQLELALATLLFLSREPGRLASLSATDNQVIVNMAFMAIPPAIALAIPIYYVSPTSLRTPLILYITAAFLEILAEPFFLLSRNALHVSVRAKIESLSSVARSICIFLFIYTSADLPDIPMIFAYAQFINGLVILLGYLLHHVLEADSPQVKLYPCPISNNQKPKLKNSLSLKYGHILDSQYRSELTPCSRSYYISPQQKTKLIRFWEQSIFKHLLTEGDKIILNWLADEHVQGIYAFVSNYGMLCFSFGEN